MSEPEPTMPLDDVPRLYTIDNLPKIEQFSKPNKGRHYKLPNGDMVPSVTNVLGILDKPALMWWGASVERDMVVEIAMRAYRTNPTSYEAFESILKGMLPRAQARFKKAKDQADIGSEAHALIQWRCKRMIDGLDRPRPKASDEAELAFIAWEEWAEKVNLVPKMTETSVWSYRMQAAGTVDLFGEQDWPAPGSRRDFAYDWKSTKTSKTRPDGIYDESLIQVSTYADMLVELGIAPPNTMACIVRLPKKFDDPFFATGELDTREITSTDRARLADGFEHIRKTFTFMQEEM